MSMEGTVDQEVQKASDYLAGLATPGRMSVAEAIEFYEGVQEDCRTALLGLHADEEAGT